MSTVVYVSNATICQIQSIYSITINWRAVVKCSRLFRMFEWHLDHLLQEIRVQQQMKENKKKQPKQ